MVADIYDWLCQTSLLSDRSLALVDEGLQRPPRQRVRPKTTRCAGPPTPPTKGGSAVAARGTASG